MFKLNPLHVRQTSDRIPRLRAAMLPVLLSCLALTACGGSNSDTVNDDSSNGEEDGWLGLEQDNTLDGEIGVTGELSEPTEDMPDDLADQDRLGLIIGSTSRCAVVGEDFDLAIVRNLTEEEQSAGILDGPQDVSAYVTLTQRLGTSLELISRGDGVVQLQHQYEDLVSLTAALSNGSVTAYLAGFAADTPESVILKKPAPGGCLYALRLPDDCVTGYAKAGDFSISIGDQGITAQGCELSNPANYPVIELAPPEESVASGTFTLLR